MEMILSLFICKCDKFTGSTNNLKILAHTEYLTNQKPMIISLFDWLVFRCL